MANHTPKIRLNKLSTDLLTCAVGSDAWFDWLDSVPSFRYFSTERRVVHPQYTCALEPISVRKEQRRNTELWYAYRRDGGILYKRYVGKTAALTQARLDEIAVSLNEV